MSKNTVIADKITAIRDEIRQNTLVEEAVAVNKLVKDADLSPELRRKISLSAVSLVEDIRKNATPSLMESFLAEYGLSTKEGVALMCLAEALLRVPDDKTIDALIEDKISTGRWAVHQGKSGSSLVNASTWALMLTGKVLLPREEKTIMSQLKGMVKRMGEPVVRKAVAQAMRELGTQFVLGRTIGEALKRAKNMQRRGYSYSYDMLGEAARTDDDAKGYHLAYCDAISQLSNHCDSDNIRLNPGISVKLSALHSRYEYGQYDQVMSQLMPRARSLAIFAKSANMGFNIDAEEADRLDLSLEVIEAILSDDSLKDWDGFGVVVQAFSKRAIYIIDWIYQLSIKLDRKIMLRLVKGAYWDSEIKRAQILGLDGFPVFTRKINSDISYITCAKKLLGMTDRIYPQFATHNAHSVAAILEISNHMQIDKNNFEFQRLHGMGESLHDSVLNKYKTNCRIYAPVGAHQDLLAYLVRRLLENGANSSFVNQIVDVNVSPEEIAKDPFNALSELSGKIANNKITNPVDIFGKDRINAKGWDITCVKTIAKINKGRMKYAKYTWAAAPIIAGNISKDNNKNPVEKFNPADNGDLVGSVVDARLEDVEIAFIAAEKEFAIWSKTTAKHRAECLNKLADLYERDAIEIFTLTCREAGKILLDSVGELREAVDFARFYANEAVRLDIANQSNGNNHSPRGIITCISPWNFPLAIFTGQILAALGAGNVVLAKPAEQTALIAAKAISLMHEAGIPKGAVQLLPGAGNIIGDAITKDKRVKGVCFTGSTPTAQLINKAMAKNIDIDAPLIAETGGLNAMIIDSTALPEQAVRDILASAFQSAGQRCSALRILYVQKDISVKIIKMLKGAMDQLSIGNPWQLSTDIGPVIDKASQKKINDHIAKFKIDGKLIKQLPLPDDLADNGIFITPTLLQVAGIEELTEEIFGAVLHIATFVVDEIDDVIDAINAKGFGLTFGLHSRVDARVNHIVERIKMGNIYVNRNQIGAVVGSQPFGGEGLSGTGPKAGGAHYMARFYKNNSFHKVINNRLQIENAEKNHIALNIIQDEIDKLNNIKPTEKPADLTILKQYLSDDAEISTAINLVVKKPHELPGPTGELNQLSYHPRGIILCLGPDLQSLKKQMLQALLTGNKILCISDENAALIESLAKSNLPIAGIEAEINADMLISIENIDAVASFANMKILRQYKLALSMRDGALLPLICDHIAPERYILERHLCVDTTAAGGNASLLAQS